MKNKTIYVDIDGTLTVETEGYGNKLYSQRTPRRDVIKLVNKLSMDGNIIIIWTSRYIEDKMITRKWLNDNGVLFDNLLFNKPKYDIFIDDKAENPNHWLNMEKEIDYESIHG